MAIRKLVVEMESSVDTFERNMQRGARSVSSFERTAMRMGASQQAAAKTTRLLDNAMQDFAFRATGVEGVTGKFGKALLALGGPLTGVAALIGVGAVAYENYTKKARAAAEAQEKLTAELIKAAQQRVPAIEQTATQLTQARAGVGSAQREGRIAGFIDRGLRALGFRELADMGNERELDRQSGARQRALTAQHEAERKHREAVKVEADRKEHNDNRLAAMQRQAKEAEFARQTAFRQPTIPEHAREDVFADNMERGAEAAQLYTRELEANARMAEEAAANMHMLTMSIADGLVSIAEAATGSGLVGSLFKAVTGGPLGLIQGAVEIGRGIAGELRREPLQTEVTRFGPGAQAQLAPRTVILVNRWGDAMPSAAQIAAADHAMRERTGLDNVERLPPGRSLAA